MLMLMLTQCGIMLMSYYISGFNPVNVNANNNNSGENSPLTSDILAQLQAGQETSLHSHSATSQSNFKDNSSSK